MRSRIALILLCSALVFGFAGCSKKEQATRTSSAATTDQPAQQAQATPPVSTDQAAPGQAPTAAPAVEPATPPPSAAVDQTPPPPPPQPIVIPAGTNLVVRVGQTLSSKSATTGQTFTGTLANGIAVKGKTVIPAGAAVTGTVSDAKSAGKFKGEAIVAIRLTSITVKGVSRKVSTDEYCVTQKGKGKRTAVVIAGGTGAGALIGGIAGGGKGAAIGALAGAGAGTAGAAFTGNKELTIPAESAASFKTTSSITLQPASQGNAD